MLTMHYADFPLLVLLLYYTIMCTYRLRAMPQRLPDVWSYNAVIRACEAAGRWREAVALLEELRTTATTAATATSTNSRGNSKGNVRAVVVVPDTVTYNLVMSALAKAGRFDQALTLLRQLQTPTSVTTNSANSASSVNSKSTVAVAADAVSYGIMCSASCAASRWQEGLKLLDQAWESGIELG
jgi:pentatricopeptide repeat protein